MEITVAVQVTVADPRVAEHGVGLELSEEWTVRGYRELGSKGGGWAKGAAVV